MTILTRGSKHTVDGQILHHLGCPKCWVRKPISRPFGASQVVDGFFPSTVSSRFLAAILPKVHFGRTNPVLAKLPAHFSPLFVQPNKGPRRLPGIFILGNPAPYLIPKARNLNLLHLEKEKTSIQSINFWVPAVSFRVCTTVDGKKHPAPVDTVGGLYRYSPGFCTSQVFRISSINSIHLEIIYICHYKDPNQ